MNLYCVSPASFVCYDNNNDALIPERWALEGIANLEEQMVMANLIHRDFENLVSDYGDVVNTRQPGTFRTKRKTDSDNVTVQDAVLTNVRVPLDQHHHVTFIIKDGEASKSFRDLVTTHLVPAVQTMARGVDRSVLGQMHRYFRTGPKRAGRLGELSASTAKGFVLEAREVLNRNKAYMDSRRLILAPGSETSLLETDIFVKANERGDGGSALENARLGRILGFDTYMAQNVPGIGSGADVATGTVTNALAAGGSGSQTVSVAGYEANVGEWATIAGNAQPAYLTAVTASTNTTAVTLSEANKFATGAGAAITIFKKVDVKGDFAAGYAKEIVVDGYSSAAVAPQVGQMISFGSSPRHTYTIIESYAGPSSDWYILLDRPLDYALSDDDEAYPGPYGDFNLAFHRDSLALVSRPLARPPQSAGVASAVMSHNDISMRVCMQYDGNAQGTRVTLDLLMGVALLDYDLGCLMLG